MARRAAVCGHAARPSDQEGSPLERRQSRPGFLVSAVVHVLILMILQNAPSTAKPRPFSEVVQPDDARRRVFLPPESVLRQLAEAQAPAPRPTPPPPPPPK